MEVPEGHTTSVDADDLPSSEGRFTAASEDGLSVIVADFQQIRLDAGRLAGVAMGAARTQDAAGEISLSIVDERRMAGLHLQYMGEPGPTDVLSFPVDGFQRRSPQPLDLPQVMIGEVVICPQVALRNNPDLASELDLLVAHGVLHLLGFDHEDKDQAQRMRAVEQQVTGRAGAQSP